MLGVKETDLRVIQYAEEGSYVKENLLPEDVIHWSSVRDHIDEWVSIYGEVTSTSFDWCEYERTVGYPELGSDVPTTYIDIGAHYPNDQLVRIVILGRVRNKFFYPPDVLFKDAVDLGPDVTLAVIGAHKDRDSWIIFDHNLSLPFAS